MLADYVIIFSTNLLKVGFKVEIIRNSSFRAIVLTTFEFTSEMYKFEVETIALSARIQFDVFDCNLQNFQNFSI